MFAQRWLPQFIAAYLDWYLGPVVPALHAQLLQGEGESSVPEHGVPVPLLQGPECHRKRLFLIRHPLLLPGGQCRFIFTPALPEQAQEIPLSEYKLQELKGAELLRNVLHRWELWVQLPLQQYRHHSRRLLLLCLRIRPAQSGRSHSASHSRQTLNTLRHTRRIIACGFFVLADIMIDVIVVLVCTHLLGEDNPSLCQA